MNRRMIIALAAVSMVFGVSALPMKNAGAGGPCHDKLHIDWQTHFQIGKLFQILSQNGESDGRDARAAIQSPP